MTTGGARAMNAPFRLPMFADGPRLVAYMLVIECVAGLSSLAALVRIPGDGGEWFYTVMLAVIAIGFEESSRRAARLRIRLSAQLRTDMTSVWAVAGSVALPRGLAVVLLVTVFTYDWFRHHRPAGEALYRKVFVISTILVGSMSASIVGADVAHLVSRDPWGLAASVHVVVTIVVYAGMQRLLVTMFLLIMGVPKRALLGTRDENLIELATLCLGGLVSLTVIYQPALAILVVAPLVTLHRGALVRELETAATTDSKTGLLNAVAWEQLAQREIARAGREQRALAVLILDLDRFKAVNDRYGHLVGDMVLRGLGRVLEATMREYDTCGRFGGEEFVAVLPNAEGPTAAMIADRVRARVNELRVADLADGHDRDDSIRLSVSIGVACAGPTDDVELAELLAAADRALYRAKADGRNCVRVAGRDDPLRELV